MQKLKVAILCGIFAYIFSQKLFTFIIQILESSVFLKHIHIEILNFSLRLLSYVILCWWLWLLINLDFMLRFEINAIEGEVALVRREIMWAQILVYDKKTTKTKLEITWGLNSKNKTLKGIINKTKLITKRSRKTNL